MIAVVLLVVGIAGVGYYRGWFALSTNNTDQMPSATITLNKEKFNEDRQKTRDEVKGLGQEAKNKISDRDGKAKEPQPQP